MGLGGTVAGLLYFRFMRRLCGVWQGPDGLGGSIRRKGSAGEKRVDTMDGGDSHLSALCCNYHAGLFHRAILYLYHQQCSIFGTLVGRVGFGGSSGVFSPLPPHKMAAETAAGWMPNRP